MNIHPFTILLDTLQSWAESGGYIFLFVVSTLEAVPLIGSTIPGHTVVILSGFLSKIGVLNVWLVMLIATLGAILGDMIGYYLGKKYGVRILERYKNHFFFKKEYVDKAQAMIATHTGKALVFGRFNPVTRPFMPLLVGASHGSPAKFWFYNVVGGILWAVSAVLLGYVFGIGYHTAAVYFGKAVVIVTIVAIISIWGYSVVNRHFHIFKKYELFVLGLNILGLLGIVETMQDASAKQSFLANLDVTVNLFVANIVSPTLIIIAKLVTTVGSTAVTGGLGLLIGVYLLYKYKWRSGFIMVSAVVSTGLFVQLLKAMFMRERPIDALLVIVNDPSFPSGHASLAAAFFLVVAYLFAPKIHSWVKRELMIVGCVLAIIAIGLSRIIINVHWVSDVIGGWSLGIFCATASILIVRYLGALLLPQRVK